jgi:hypothetical protein
MEINLLLVESKSRVLLFGIERSELIYLYQDSCICYSVIFDRPIRRAGSCSQAQRAPDLDPVRIDQNRTLRFAKVGISGICVVKILKYNPHKAIFQQISKISLIKQVL